MSNKYVFLIPVFLAGTMLQLHAQTLRAYEEAAEEALASKDYYSAITRLETVLEVDPDRFDLKYKLAKAAYEYGAYELADSLLNELSVAGDVTKYPDIPYHQGVLKQTLGEYQKAINYFQIYLSENEGVGDSTKLAQAEKRIASSQWALEQFQIADDSTTVERMDESVNTVYSEFGARKTMEKFYFTSLRFEKETEEKPKEPEIPGKLYSRVLEMLDTVEQAVPMDEQLNDVSRHTAHITFNRDSTRVYYTLCEYINMHDVRCGLYFKDIRDTLWGEATRLPDPINLEGYTSSEPHVAYNEYIGSEVLYFVSDRPGGKGKQDIWYTKINDANSFTEPVNVKGLNTEEDDNAPFYHEETSTMYFSSTGYLGFGNYDVFKSERTDKGWKEPVNLGSNINTSFDEAFYTLSPDEGEGYFSSNRIGSLYLEARRKACCYDIYKVTREPVEVNLIVETFNKRTGEPLPYVTLYIEQKNGEVLRVTQTTGDSNRLEMPLKRNKHYTITGEKLGFENDSVQFSTYNITKSEDIHKKLYLDVAEIPLKVLAFEKRTKIPLPNVTVTLTNETTGESQDKTNERSHITFFVLQPGNDYGLTGKRKGYRQATNFVSQSELLDADTVVKELYLELGNLEEFLPLAIYFDNDVPDPRSKKPITDLTYLETYDNYYASKDDFKRKFSKGVSGEEEREAEAAIEKFFDQNLRKSKEEFESFLNILHQYLDEGLSFKIFLKGYTSPLASAQYNYNLGQRRIKTIQNQFKVFRDGVLMKYFESGDLEVLEKSFGEETAPQGISDDRTNPRGSIYSPEASKERRVEIIEIQKDNPQQ